MGLKLNIIKTTLGNLLSKAFTNRYLLITNLGLSVSMSATGDLLEQNYEIVAREIDQIDYKRTRNLAVAGLTVGFVCHYWYKYLDKILPGYTIRIVAKKVVIDQFIASPLCLVTFFSTMGYLECKTVKDILEQSQSKAIKLYSADWMIWPPAQFINFYILPNQYRVLFDNTISLGFDIYTSRVNHVDEERHGKFRK